MSRVLVVGGVSEVGGEIVRKLLADPAYDVRVADSREAPRWMREACEIRHVDLSDFEQALAAIEGCSHVIRLAGLGADGETDDFSLLATSAAIDSSLLRAAVRLQIERFVYVSPASASEAAENSAAELAKQFGERLCQAARTEYGLSFVICRTPTNVDDIVAALD